MHTTSKKPVISEFLSARGDCTNPLSSWERPVLPSLCGIITKLYVAHQQALTASTTCTTTTCKFTKSICSHKHSSAAPVTTSARRDNKVKTTSLSSAEFRESLKPMSKDGFLKISEDQHFLPFVITLRGAKAFL